MRKTRLLSFIALITIASSLNSEPYTVQPELIDTILMEDYRKIWGSPDGAFFLQKKSGVDIRHYPSIENRSISYRANQKFISSERGNYYALISYNNFLPTQLQVTAISVFDRSGNLVWTNPGPGCSAFFLTDHAPVAVGIEGAEGFAESRLVFFNSSGEVVGSAKVQNFYNGQFSENGENFFGITGAGNLIKFSNTGREIQNYGPATRYYSSFDASLVAVVRDTATRIYSGETVIATWPVAAKSLREVRFSRDNRMVAALYSDRFDVSDITAGSLLAEYTLDDASYRFFHFDTDPNFNYFVCSANNSADSPEVKNTKGRIMLLSAGGNLLWGEEVAYEEWSVRYPDVRIDSNNRVVSMLTATTLQVFKF
ncbi:MAG: hypothetical protein WBP29_04375 [Candidatus Zixiibacteriota bacterium]